ncbi:hypothetical protein BUALT_Bualt17G0097100 [Buddleja alternifolia]|uniref:Uncharacterized protein n=1 Tax=Buddleja alternifolia TaxID=168488 RepID=A0AAV6WFR9_9LAMI|nr:hypothetical protein BUALT_Bualt17G0097100 [Buddleja alternifolia]
MFRRDDEVDEFFAAAVNYFKNRDGVKCIHRELTATPRRSPSLETEHLDGVKKVTEISDENPNGVLDLNSYPDSDELVNDSDSV